MQASFVVLKFDDEEIEEVIDFEDQHEDLLVEEENSVNFIIQEVDESNFEVANEEEVEDTSDKHRPSKFHSFDHKKLK